MVCKTGKILEKLVCIGWHQEQCGHTSLSVVLVPSLHPSFPPFLPPSPSILSLHLPLLSPFISSLPHPRRPPWQVPVTCLSLFPYSCKLAAHRKQSFLFWDFYSGILKGAILEEKPNISPVLARTEWTSLILGERGVSTGLPPEKSHILQLSAVSKVIFWSPYTFFSQWLQTFDRKEGCY